MKNQFARTDLCSTLPGAGRLQKLELVFLQNVFQHNWISAARTPGKPGDSVASTPSTKYLKCLAGNAKNIISYCSLGTDNNLHSVVSRGPSKGAGTRMSMNLKPSCVGSETALQLVLPVRWLPFTRG